MHIFLSEQPEQKRYAFSTNATASSKKILKKKKTTNTGNDKKGMNYRTG